MIADGNDFRHIATRFGWSAGSTTPVSLGEFALLPQPVRERRAFAGRRKPCLAFGDNPIVERSPFAIAVQPEACSKRPMLASVGSAMVARAGRSPLPLLSSPLDASA